MRRAGRVVSALVVLLGVLCWAPRPAGAHTPHDVINGLALSPRFASDATVYTISREYLLKSTDGGTTWKRLNRGLDNKFQLSSVQIDQQDPDRLYASSRGDGVFRSDDGGASWERTASLGKGRSSVLHLRVSPHDGDHLYATSPEQGVTETTDGGRSWKAVAGFERTAVGAVAFDPTDPDVAYMGTGLGLRRTSDGGASWEPVGSGVLRGAEVHDIAVVDDGAFALVGTDAGLFRLTGDDLEPIGEGIEDADITTVGETGDTLLAVSWTEGPYRSTDGGDSWTLVDEGLTTTKMAADVGRPDFDGLAASPDHDTVLLGGFDGLFHSTDVDAGWEELTTQDSTNLVSLAVSPNYAEDGSVLVTTYVNGPKLSTDHGDTWTGLGPGVAFQYDYLREPDYYTRLTGSLFAPDYATSGRLYTMSRGYLFTTDDPATPWTGEVVDDLIVPDPPPDYLIPGFSPDYAEDRTLIAGTDSGRLLRMVGDGDLEMFDDIGEEILALVPAPDFEEDGTYFLATATGIYRGGSDAHPEAFAGSPTNATSLAVSPGFADDGTIFVGTKRGLFVTRDAGATWDEVPWSTGAAHPYVESVVLSPSYADDGFALVSERGHGLSRSTDGGDTWATTGQDLLDQNVVLSSFYHPTGEPIAFSPDFAKDRTIFGTAETVLYRSTDAGATWTPLDIPKSTHPLTAESAPGGLIEPDFEAAHAGHSGTTAQSTSDAPGTTLLLTPRRVLASLLAAAVVFAALSLRGVTRRLSPKVLALGFNAACGLVVLLLALFVLGRRG
ncbi:MAG: hypothetical protein KF906_11810 [Actinobacteria bacterium]|nr:hypothetical protein [Actinomycetota bacterium]